MALKEPENINLSLINTPSDYIAAASSTETLEQIEEVVTAWIKQIEQVLIANLHNHTLLQTKISMEKRAIDIQIYTSIQIYTITHYGRQKSPWGIG